MDPLLVAARVVLAAVFAVAGAAKLADLQGSRAAVAAFGVPIALAAPLGTLLPVLELAIAGLLAFSATARLGAALALGVLIAFSAGISRSIARGESPDCHCFGQLHSEPAGPRTLFRNLILAGVSAFALLAGEDAGPGLAEAAAALDPAGRVAVAAGLALVALTALGGAALLALLRQNGMLVLRVEALEAALRARGIPIPQSEGTASPQEGLPVGSPAPPFSLPGLDGDAATLASLRAAGSPVLLIFTDPACGPCRKLMPQVGRWQRERADDLTIAVITRGVSEDLRAEVAEHGLETVLVESDAEVSSAYRAVPTPSAVLIDRKGRIGSPLAAGDRSVEALAAGARGPARV